MINKGVGKQVEFKGLRAQYVFIFAGGLLGVFVLFVVLYMMGAPPVVCITIAWYWVLRWSGSLFI